MVADLHSSHRGEVPGRTADDRRREEPTRDITSTDEVVAVAGAVVPHPRPRGGEEPGRGVGRPIRMPGWVEALVPIQVRARGSYSDPPGRVPSSGLRQPPTGSATSSAIDRSPHS